MQKLAVVLHRPGYRQLASRDAGLTQAVKPFVGLHFDDQLVPAAYPDREGLDVGDFHEIILVSAQMLVEG